MLSRSLLVSALAVLAGSGVLAQDLSGLPTCAQTCAFSGISASGCAITDIKCVCSATAFLQTVGDCTAKACSADDIQKTDAFAVQLCASYGVTLNIPGQGQPAASSSAAAPSTTAAATTPYATSAATTAAATTTAKPAGNSTTIAPTGSVKPTVPFTGGAPAMQVGGWLGGLAAAAGLVFAL